MTSDSFLAREQAEHLTYTARYVASTLGAEPDADELTPEQLDAMKVLVDEVMPAVMRICMEVQRRLDEWQRAQPSTSSKSQQTPCTIPRR